LTRALFALPFFLLLQACTCGERRKASCLGCSNDSGLCESGMRDSACGAGGAACIACDEGIHCLEGFCPVHLDGGRSLCGGVTCDITTADLCLGTTCSCGGGPPCTPGAVCDRGACRCDGTTCDGCCTGPACTPLHSQALAACGRGGAACQSCLNTTVDNCGDGECRCGVGPPCGQDLVCSGGLCGCGCTGCCTAGACRDIDSQDLSTCGAINDPCRACPVVTANLCSGGSCKCGSGPACPDGLHCMDDACVCDAVSCPGGCCQGTTCIAAAEQTTSQCGPIGGSCIACPADAGCLNIGCDCATRLTCGAKAAAAGAAHACAVTAYGELRCWGAALDGGADLLAPRAALSGASLLGSLTSGSGFSCAEGPFSVDCVGALAGTFNGRLRGLSAGAHHVCGMTIGGKPYCWGDNTFGQLGILGADGGVQPGGAAAGPTEVTGLAAGVDAISAGATHTCALKSGQVLCWGKFDASGSTPYDSALPRAIALDAGAVAVASGEGVSCAAGSGTVSCWGRSPSTVQLDAVALGVGSGFACGLTDAGAVQCWGSNAVGQLGNPDGGAVEQGGPFTQLSVGSDFACAVGANRQVYCWGDGLHGQLGTGMPTSSPVPVLVAD
jgi:hypothetical protein